ncbi:hypothetical protein ACOSQ3_004891 [Xanthoceras sorbifolium]
MLTLDLKKHFGSDVYKHRNGYRRLTCQLGFCLNSTVTEVPRKVKTKKSRDCRTRVRNYIFPAYILVVLL